MAKVPALTVKRREFLSAVGAGIAAIDRDVV
jgi:hypothetical protein